MGFDFSKPIITPLPEDYPINNIKCPECGASKYYRIIYTDDKMTDVKFYDCMICYTHWDKDGKNLGKF